MSEPRALPHPPPDAPPDATRDGPAQGRSDAAPAPRPRGPLPGALRPLTIPASWLYAALIAWRNRRFQSGHGVHHIDRPVISIGNITTGGTGKTPMVMWIAGMLRGHGHQPVVAMRGYKAPPGERGDEEAEYALSLPDVEVVASADRVGALRRHFTAGPATAPTPPGDCVLLDDGFQHRRLHRDLDLALVNASRATLDDRVLPAGHLRESIASLRRADAIVVTHADAIDDVLAARIATVHGRAPIAWVRHVWPSLRRFDPSSGSEEGQAIPVQWLRGKRVLTLLGVGHPEAIHARLRRAGADVVVSVPARDHERYSAARLEAVRQRAQGLDAVLTTRKDWVKARHMIEFSDWSVPVVVPDLALEFLDGEGQLTQLVLDAIANWSQREAPCQPS